MPCRGCSILSHESIFYFDPHSPLSVFVDGCGAGEPPWAIVTLSTLVGSIFTSIFHFWFLCMFVWPASHCGLHRLFYVTVSSEITFRSHVLLSGFLDGCLTSHCSWSSLTVA